MNINEDLKRRIFLFCLCGHSDSVSTVDISPSINTPCYTRCMLVMIKRTCSELNMIIEQILKIISKKPHWSSVLTWCLQKFYPINPTYRDNELCTIFTSEFSNSIVFDLTMPYYFDMITIQQYQDENQVIGWVSWMLLYYFDYCVTESDISGCVSTEKNLQQIKVKYEIFMYDEFEKKTCSFKIKFSFEQSSPHVRLKLTFTNKRIKEEKAVDFWYVFDPTTIMQDTNTVDDVWNGLFHPVAC